jgi:methionyl-tRNA formyltransferase
MPPLGCINVHASLLPRHRGVSPIQAAILAGDAVTGCTTMHIDEGVDTGDILLQAETPVQPDETAGSLSARLAVLGADLLIQTLDGIVDGTVQPTPQDPARATSTKKIRKAHGAIDWSRDADHLARLVRAMSPWPSAYTTHDGKRLIIEEAVATDGIAGAHAGHVTSVDPLVVACATGALEIRRLRPEGRRAMTPREYAAGHRLVAGDRLGSND